MFGFLKKKLGDVISKFSDKAEEQKEEKDTPREKAKERAVAAEAKPTAAEIIEQVQHEEEAPILQKHEEAKAPYAEIHTQEPITAEKVVAHQPKPEFKEIKVERHDEIKREEPAEAAREEPKKKSLFGRITSAFTEAVTTTKISGQKFEEMFSELEMAMLENNVAVEVIDKIKADLSESLVEKPLQRGKVEEAVRAALRGSIEELFTSGYDLKGKIMAMAAEKKPVKVMFVGINGSGKTTTIAKMAKMLQNSGLKPVIAASDTFRAAAIHQLQEHADKLGVKLIKHDYGADPAAVAFDAVKYAEAHSIDAVLIDTAGRLHSNVNLIDEMKKISRVAKPDFKIFVGEAITGNDCVEQARSFNEAIGIDGIILAKADVDEKGGAAISVSYVTKKPIFYLGTGQRYEDIAPFRAEMVVEQLGLAA